MKRIAWWLVSTCTGFLTAGQTNIATANYGTTRANSNLTETTLTQFAVSSGGFGKLGVFPVDGQIYAQPLYISGVQMPGQGAKNVVFVATMNDSVYAIDADAPGSTTPLWKANLGTPVPSVEIPGLEYADPQVGILSTPVIDPAAQVIYVVAETWEAGAPVFRLHGLSLATGEEMKNGPVVIAASVAGTGAASVNGTITFDPFWHLQRVGLTLANGAIYIGFGSHNDAGDYHGWIMAYNASDLQQQTAVFNSTPNGAKGGIWQAGRALAVDDAGNLFVVTGNGDYDGVANFGCSVVKLAGSNLAVLDWYTPAEWEYLSDNDLDLGSTGAILIPGSNLLVTADKGGRLVYLNQGSLGHLESSAGLDNFQASETGIYGLALWQTSLGTTLYEHDQYGFLKGYPVTATAIGQTPVSTGNWIGDALYQGMAVSSNGVSDGIVWETTGISTAPGVPGTLHAWNAYDLAEELWNSDMNPADVLGSFGKFVAPTVANGRVYVPTFSNALVIYGLGAAGGQAPQIASVLNAGSLIENSVSPGEILAIYGTNLSAPVLFDGIAAPVVSASAGEMEVMAPFGVAGAQTQMAIGSASLTLPVAAASPALFTASKLGTGQAAAWNENGQTNSVVNPAAAGSIVSLLATGLGQSGLPVSVLIGGLPGYVLYAGAAPGMVEGVFQINVRIPATAPSGSSVPVVLRVGEFFSQTGVSIAVQ